MLRSSTGRGNRGSAGSADPQQLCCAATDPKRAGRGEARTAIMKSRPCRMDKESEKSTQSVPKEANLHRTAKISAIIIAAALLGSPAQAGVCEWVGGSIGATGAVVASASTVAEAAGLAAVPHVSGAAIATSVGVGGTGFIAGTLGTIGATALSIVSAPAVIAGAAGVAVVGGGTAAYCYFSD